ncbi:hypothetical protein BC943DRAFT_327033 [Umbelopsis sp. AD052]|nr:hypothetical protein BC943DRAFT_327033 [Umbelopsis sp. AD052]
MRAASLSEELDSITKDYDFGIVPGSAAIFVKDEENFIGRLDLTILEGILVIIEVDDQGYKVLSCSPIYSFETTKSVLEHIEATLYKPFETMESLLMTISPMFQAKFQEALYNKLANINAPSTSNDQQPQGNHSQGNQSHMSQEAIIALLNDDPTSDPNWNIKNI